MDSLGKAHGKRPYLVPGGAEPGSGFPPPLEDPAGLQLGSAPSLRSCLSERIFLFFSRRGLTFTGAKPIIMGSVQIFGGQSKAGETGLCQPSWSSDESPSVALSAIRRRLCCCRSARHRSSGRRRSGTLCVLRLASCLSWVLSAQLTTLQLMRERDLLQLRDHFFLRWLAHTSVITVCAAPTGHPFFLKKGVLRKAPGPSFFQKSAARLLTLYSILCIKPRPPSRARYRKRQKNRTSETRNAV